MRCLLLRFIFFIFVCPAFAQATSNPATVVNGVIVPFMAKNTIPGVAVALYNNGQTYFYNYGVANQKTQQPVTQHTIFELGSVTKVFTATLLAQEVNAGVMALNDPVVKYLPAAASANNGPITQVTLLELATHTASLPRNPPHLSLAARPNYTEANLLNYVAHWQPSKPIGSTYQYSNIGFGLLGDALIGATHQSYTQLLQTNILNPLKMNDTRLNGPTDPVRYAQGYDAQGIAPHWPVNAWPAAGALRSTSTDMMAFLEANLGVSATASPVLISAMQFAQQGRFQASGFMQALAWAIPNNRLCTPVIVKDGATAGFSSFIALLPAKKIGIVLLTNKTSAQFSLGPVAMRILHQLAGC